MIRCPTFVFLNYYNQHFSMKNLIAFLLSALSISVVVGQATGETNLRVIEQNTHEIVMELDLMGVKTQKITTAKGEAILPVFEDGTPLLAAGKPDLQKLATALMIPNTGSMAIEILATQYRDFSNIEIAPSKGNFKRNIDPATVPFVYGPTYKEDAFFPGQLADLQQAFIFRDVRGQALWFYPVQYNPVQKTMRVYSNITLRVYRTEAPGQNEITSPNSPKKSRSFELLYQQIFINAQQTVASRGGGPTEPEKMLVIAKDEFEDDLLPFLTWKRQTGLHTTLVLKSEINTLDPSGLYNFIKKYYEEEGISYLLIVGDDAAFAPEMRNSGGTNYACDPCFGYMEGNDHLPEILVGRWHAANTQQLKIMINRNLRYEKTPLVDGGFNWAEHGVWAASNEGEGIGDDKQADFEHANEWKTRQLQSGYAKFWEFYDGDHASISPTPGDETSDKPGNPVNSDIVNVMNTRGIGVFNYTGHGWEQGLVSSNFNTDAVKKMRNDQAFPFLLAVACCTGNFTNNSGGDCLGEAWQRAGDLITGSPWGGIAGFFSSDFQSWAPPMEGQDAMNELMEISEQQNLNPDFASMLAFGNAKMIVAYAQAGEAMADFWNPFAEPATMPRTRMPQALTATHPAEMTIGENSLVVNSPVEGAVIGLYWKGQAIASGVIENGQTVLQFPGLTEVGELTLTATHRNRIPYQGNIAIKAGNGPFVVYSAYTLNDSTGNKNQNADYGERIFMHLKLSNVGNAQAANAIVELSADSPYLTVIDGTETYGELAANTDSTRNNVFEFKVSPFAPNKEKVNFDLKITYDNNKVYQGKIAIRLYAPEMTIGAYKINDLAGGDGDGILESGESARVTIENYNTGQSLSPDAVGDLRCNLPWVQIGAPFQIGKLLPGATLTETQFLVTIPANSPQYELALFQYTLSAGAYKDESSFQTIINPVIETFESKTFTAFPWMLKGAKPWIITTNSNNGGKFCARSGTISDNENSIMRLNLDFTKDGEISFERRVSSEQDYDYLLFYIDGKEMAAWSGILPWAEVRFPVTAGVHELEWRYEKDELGKDGSDAAWVDKISMPPYKVIVATQNFDLDKAKLKVFPNPTHDLLQLSGQWAQATSDMQIRLFDAQGRLVLLLPSFATNTNGNFEVMMDINTLRSGMYLIQLSDGQHSISQKVIRD